MSTETIEVNVGDAVSRGADATAKADSGKMALNVGPSHPTTHGVLRLMMDLDGDVITRCEPVLGYLHRGDEKIAENMTYNQFVPYTGSVGLSFSVGQQCRLCNRC
jgi:NADH-quinone oxidoreductase subunit D